jgi:protein SOK2
MKDHYAFRYKPKGGALPGEKVFQNKSCLLLWSDFGTDNDMINGTKPLNVAGMIRGRRDQVLKAEKMRHVVKIGPMNLKGVWYVKEYLWETSYAN